MKYFEKIAVGPTIQLSNIKYAPTGAAFMKSTSGETKIVGNLGENKLPWMKGSTLKSLKRHELVHYLRDKKKNRSAKKYHRNRAAAFTEEFAAYKRSGTSFGRSLQGAVATAAGHGSKIFNLLKKIK